jgi:hypothetical protein
LAPVKFRITRHSGFASPPNAIDLLAERLGPKREEVSFGKVGAEIRATWGEDARSSRVHEERAETGRRVVLDIVRDVCDGDPELRSDWFAISAFP